jgi:hypothetical protein
VDDFLVRYSHPSELEHLVSCLSTLYELKVHRDLSRYTYLGYTVDCSPTSSSPCMTLSNPNYIPSMLSHFCPSGCGSASSPAVYTPPVSPTDSSLHLSPSSTATLFSTPVSPAEKTWIQQVIGSLLFDARALDLFLLTAVCQLSSHQSTPTQHDLTSAHRLLNCASSHRDPNKTIHPSSMALGLHRRQLLVPTKADNAPLHAFCQRIPVVVASVAEAKYAAAFGGDQVLVELTLTLTNLGHPQ